MRNQDILNSECDILLSSRIQDNLKSEHDIVLPATPFVELLHFVDRDLSEMCVQL